MSAAPTTASGTAAAAAAAVRQQQEHQDVALGAILAGIDSCLRRWKASRDEGQVVLTELSNALLLRTYVDRGRRRRRLRDSDSDDGSAAAVWGALARAGATVPRVSVATEARARRLHGDLDALQDAMLAAAAGVRRHAQEARRRCCGRNLAAEGESQRHPIPGNCGSISGGGGSAVAAAHSVGVKPVEAAAVSGAMVGAGGDERGAVIGGGYGLVDLADAASEVADMLLKEGLVTATVAQGVGQESNGEDREALTVYAAAWMMQPYVDVRRVKELETMVRGRERGRV